MDRSRPAIITTHAHNTAINIQRVEWSDTSIKKYHVATLIDSISISINLSNISNIITLHGQDPLW